MSLFNTTLSTAIRTTSTITTSTVVESSATASATGSPPSGSTGASPVGGFSTGGKVGCALGAAVVVGLLIFWLRPKKHKKKTTVHPDVREHDTFKDKTAPIVGTLETGGNKAD